MLILFGVMMLANNQGLHEVLHFNGNLNIVLSKLKQAWDQFEKDKDFKIQLTVTERTDWTDD